MEEYLD
jgi:hypothetical protein